RIFGDHASILPVSGSRHLSKSTAPMLVFVSAKPMPCALPAKTAETAPWCGAHVCGLLLAASRFGLSAQYGGLVQSLPFLPRCHRHTTQWSRRQRALSAAGGSAKSPQYVRG